MWGETRLKLEIMATPFGRKIDSDILISSSSGFKTPVIFLTKLIHLFGTVSQPANVTPCHVINECPLLTIKLMEVLRWKENRNI